MSAAEMLAKIKREEELKRVNMKFGRQQSGSDSSPLTPSKPFRSDTFLQKTSNMVEDEIMLLMDKHD